ncbi:hypothetical protein B7494_g6589 [Chlorociboria aeruginascens]|nr:hypothetical protein B7494_g6589 [Chlorociboria aeruginascens]
MDNNPQRPPDLPQAPEAPDKEKMEQIRRRRMEKLAGPTPPKPEASTQEGDKEVSSSASPNMAQSTPVPATAKPKINITKASTSENPFQKLVQQSDSSSASTVRLSSRGGKKHARTEDEQVTSRPAPRKVAALAGDESIDVWEHKALSHAFRITLDSDEPTDSPNHRSLYLKGLRQDLEDEGAEVRLTRDRLDSALLEAASAVPHNKSVLDYLLPCWKRINKALKGLKGYADQKDEILKEARRLCLSYCIFAVSMPDLFGHATDSLTPYLLNEPAEEKGIDQEFLREAVARFGEDLDAKSMLTKAVSGLSLQLSNMTMNDNYKPYMNAMKLLTQFAPIVTAIAEDPLFQMATSAPGIEKHTLLGPFFRISPLQFEVTKEYFNSPKTMDKRHISTSQEALRMTLQTHQRDLLDIINHFVRASPVSKNKTLDWFAYVVNQNHKRRAMRVDSSAVSSDGFMMNITVVLDGLCEPFMDTTFSKVSRIEVDYLRRSPRVDIKDETKLNADENASKEYYENKLDGTSNFISEIFFLTLTAHHYGSEATNAMLKSLDRDIKNITKELAMMEAERAKINNQQNPASMRVIETNLKRYNEVLDKSMSLKLATEGVLFDKNMQTKSLLFMRYVTVWLLRIATGSDYTPDKSVKLPLSAHQPDAFKFLPEYVLEDIVGNFNFVFKYVPEIMISAVGDEIIALCITFLTNSEYIKNPYLKAKLVTLLFQGTWPIYHRTKGVLGDALTGTKFSNDHLLHALMKFYIEVESTGAHTQFYDKFNIRYEIFQVIKCIWTNDIYKQRLTQESKTNTEFFLQFVNLLLNDATYVLDEALTKFPKIHDLQASLRQPEGNLTPEQRTTNEEELATAEGQAQSYMQLTNETVSMMKLFTSTLSASFTMPEIVDRVAAMVDYTLDTLVGPKSTNLKVDDPSKYQFSPKVLLGEFVDIYLNLGVSSNFIEAVARDGRSYKPANFDNASRIVTRFSLKSAEEIARWEALKAQFKTAKEIDDQAEEDLGDIPEEFLDPLMWSLMKDPVILPVSRTSVDRSTIRSHLLSDPHDPFNRAPLKIEEVVDDVELRSKIEAWLVEKKDEARRARNGSGEKMDIS